jgi:hypothetical protein
VNTLDELIVGLAISTTPSFPQKPVYLRLLTGMKFPLWTDWKKPNPIPRLRFSLSETKIGTNGDFPVEYSM